MASRPDPSAERNVIVATEEHGERKFCHPWCSRWKVPRTPSLPKSAACKRCGETFPVRWLSDR